MAYINGQWIVREERQNRINILSDRVRKFAELIKSGKHSDHHVDMFRRDKAELAKLKRIHRGEYDLLYFALTYFSADENPTNDANLIPAGVGHGNSADFHKTLCGLLNDVVTGRQKTNVAWACPRGSAKTGYLSNIFLCHQVVYRHRRYIIEISETTDVAGDFVSWTSNQLKFNEKIIDDFGVLLHRRKSQNEVDNKYEFITTTGTKVEAKGAATQTRGLRHQNTRPDLAIADDLESKANTNTPELIEKNKQWFREELLPALSRNGIMVYMGTILCYDSLLDYVIRDRRDFESRKFPAIISWSDREDLWNKWREIYRSDDQEAGKKAKEFYKVNEGEMLKGTKVLWPQMFTYLDLMVLLEENGTKAFNQEYLNEPTDSERQIFKPEYFHHFTEDELIGKDFDYIAAADFAMGKEKGDYSAFITLARNRDTGVCYIVDVFMERVHPDEFLRIIVEKTMKYQYHRLAVEAQQAQEWFADKLAEELRRHGYPSMTRLDKVKHRTRKQLRIEALLPDIQNGKIRFSKNDRLFLDMLLMYPMHPFDDGPDCLSMAFSAAKSAKKITLMSKPSWL